MALGHLAPIRCDKNSEQSKHVYCNVSEGVNLNKIVSKHGTEIGFGAKFNILECGCLGKYLGREHVSQQQVICVMFPTKW